MRSMRENEDKDTTGPADACEAPNKTAMLRHQAKMLRERSRRLDMLADELDQRPWAFSPEANQALTTAICRSLSEM